MHELSIALSILEIAEEESQRQGGARVTAIHVKLGPLSGVVKEALLSAFELACEQTPMEGCRLVLKEVPIVVYCPHCEGERSPVSVQEIRCCDCGTPTPKIVSGQELDVVAMEVMS